MSKVPKKKIRLEIQREESKNIVRNFGWKRFFEFPFIGKKIKL